MASTAGLIPITRAFLAKFYDKYPFDPISSDKAGLLDRLKSLSDDLEKERIEAGGVEGLADGIIFETPHKLDENLWKNREQIEEILHLIDSEHWPETLKGDKSPETELLLEATTKWEASLKETLATIQKYQEGTSEKVSTMVFTYMPQDFRGTLLKQQKDSSEKRRQREVETLLASGGTIKQKYALLWQQQMDRRKMLASLGSATGIYRTLVTLLAGVPQVLLDFVKTINDHNGPMEEQRLRYGPHLYELTEFVNRLLLFVTLWWASFDSSLPKLPDFVGLVTDAINLYSSELTRFIATLKEIFENSPFLISADDALSAEDKSKVDEFKEVTIANGVTHEVPLTVDAVGTVVAWEFSLTSGADVGFRVDYLDESGTKTGMFPYQRLKSHQGSFDAPGVGSYVMSWDNTYSYLTKKVIRVKVGAIPPVETEEAVAAEEALSHAAD